MDDTDLITYILLMYMCIFTRSLRLQVRVQVKYLRAARLQILKVVYVSPIVHVSNKLLSSKNNIETRRQSNCYLGLSLTLSVTCTNCIVMYVWGMRNNLRA